MNSPAVQFAFYRKVAAVEWRKLPGEWSIVEKGRWGPRWLHRLVWRAATNLGMIRHAREMTERIRTVTIDRRSRRDIFQEMRVACLYGFDAYGFRPNAIEIVCGECELDELADCPTIARSLSFELAGPFCDARSRARIDGVPVRVVAGLKGWAVLPID